MIEPSKELKNTIRPDGSQHMSVMVLLVRSLATTRGLAEAVLHITSDLSWPPVARIVEKDDGEELVEELVLRFDDVEAGECAVFAILDVADVTIGLDVPVESSALSPVLLPLSSLSLLGELV